MPAIAESAFTHTANIAKPVASAFPTFVVVIAAMSAFLAAVAVAAVATVIFRRLYRAVGSRACASSVDAEAQPLLAAAVIHEYGAVSYVSPDLIGAQSYGSQGRAEYAERSACECPFCLSRQSLADWEPCYPLPDKYIEE
ncbi:hypothetical protein EXIGLDRAFT_769334 [Exidia glandulosa HHB12029]|uniref:Uncharacterized protein n=1 Tax=Exidia glandulosa HHB12029 TaxID=1314781 RepID=A0A165HJ32_EXIGL|nr:hypothetical protein EXIGLDRAFT_769334 [Exidia glandulosa HHB12029]